MKRQQVKNILSQIRSLHLKHSRKQATKTKINKGKMTNEEPFEYFKVNKMCIYFETL